MGIDIVIFDIWWNGVFKMSIVGFGRKELFFLDDNDEVNC